jgi:hypothetical protein
MVERGPSGQTHRAHRAIDLPCSSGSRAMSMAIRLASLHWLPHIVWWESEHESHSTAVDVRHRPLGRDAVLCAVRVKLFAEFRVSVLRRRSIPGAGVRLIRLWGSTRPHDEPVAIPAWAASRVTSDRRARPPGFAAGRYGSLDCRSRVHRTPGSHSGGRWPARRHAQSRLHVHTFLPRNQGKRPAGEG